MTSDQQRLEALKRGLGPSESNRFVAIAAQDLRWLLQLAESPQRDEPFTENPQQDEPFVVLDQAEGEETE